MGIKIYKKSVYDISNSLPTTTVTDLVAFNTGEDFIDLIRNRNNISAWQTTESIDAANTTIEINFNDLKEFDRLLLLKHNFKAFTIKYRDEDDLMWLDFSTPINETTNAIESNYYEFDMVETDKVQIIIYGTMVADSDKYLTQLIMCEAVGEFKTQPRINPTLNRDRKSTKYLSGKSFVAKSVGGFQCTLIHNSVAQEDESDLELIEKLFNYYEGFLVSLSGGNIAQYLGNVREAYRLEDVYFCACANEYNPEFLQSRYAMGLPIDLNIVEVN